MPEFRLPFLAPIGTFSVLTLPCDNGTWSVTLVISAGDKPLKRLRDADLWAAVVAACPLHAHWLEGEPISGVLAMGGVIDRYRRFSIHGEPVVTGIAAVGDAWACTNPSLGRGMSFGLLHVQHLRDVVRGHLDDPREFAEAFEAATEAELTPWYRETVAEDRARHGEIDALRRGLDPAPQRDSSARLRAALLAVARTDPDAFRAFLASRCCITRLQETFADAACVERILALAADSEPPPLPGPNRDQVLRILDGSRAPA
jgi:flavin-dependent dehydrogenase